MRQRLLLVLLLAAPLAAHPNHGPGLRFQVLEARRDPARPDRVVLALRVLNAGSHSVRIEGWRSDIAQSVVLRRGRRPVPTLDLASGQRLDTRTQGLELSIEGILPERRTQGVFTLMVRVADHGEGPVSVALDR